MKSTLERIWIPDTIVSGGQTGVDRAALDWACQTNISHGGWCPKGRLAADGPLPSRYLLRETESDGYRQRTKLNVQDSDATLIFNMGLLEGGTRQTVKFAQTLGRPYRIIQMDAFQLQDSVAEVQSWLKQGRFSTLNIAGPSEARRPGIYACVLQVLAACTEPA
jgi:hypothetical protein